MSLMHRYKDKEIETLPTLGKCATLHKHHGNYIFVMIFNKVSGVQSGIKINEQKCKNSQYILSQVREAGIFTDVHNTAL